MIRAILLLSATLAGCTEHVQLGGGDPLTGLVSMTVSPTNQTLELVGLNGPPLMMAYTAMGEFADGSTRDITSLVDWQVDNPAPGGFAADHRYLPSRRAAGDVTIRAASGEIIGTSQLRVSITASVNDSAFPPPPGAEALFDPGTPALTDPMRSPRILYPAQDTMFPQGLPHILFQHQVGTGNDALRLRFKSAVLDLTVFTSADRWQPDNEIWYLLSASHPGSQVDFTVAGASTAAAGTIYTSPQETLRFAADEPAGLLTYGLGTGNAILRAKLGSTAATKFYPAPGDSTLVGSHTLSRDGASMALRYAGDLLQKVRVADQRVEIASTAAIPMGWAAFSPDGTKLLVANQGQLVLRDARTGAPIGAAGGVVDLPMKATHPDWSPDGTKIAIAMSSEVTNAEIRNGAIAIVPYDEKGFGAPVIVVPAGGMNNNAFPRWSPDGRFLAYVNSRGPGRAPRSAELRLVPATGGTPLQLARANRRVNGSSELRDLGNTMPWWSPSQGTMAWLSFSSARPYGAILPTVGQDQIWIAGLDLARPEDPSFAAFWLPAQDVRLPSNNPVWVVEPASASE
jgi:WD40-like Beta Propeller Repeat